MHSQHTLLRVWSLNGPISSFVKQESFLSLLMSVLFSLGYLLSALTTHFQFSGNDQLGVELLFAF